MNSSQTLTEALAEIGVTHERGAVDGKRDLIAADVRIGSFDAAEGWEFVRTASCAA